MTVIERKFIFSAAHRLPDLPEDHKCHALHGHTYTVILQIGGPVDPRTGFVLDFGEVDARWKALVHSKLDHKYLNEVEGLEQPTSERICVWIYEKVQPAMPPGTRITEVIVSETPYSCARYRPCCG